ncbi:MAG: glycosyltransferase [Candidatus Electrothrix sp. GM3_4]|nr:glycosyltransferase [Candidatus Electrothrix sp. GM3_4]
MREQEEHTGVVSVIVPTYNCGEWIGQTIESVLAQTYDNFELIIVDDGSTDNTCEIIKKYLPVDNLQYVIQKNSGQASARNHGLKLASGQYVAYLDADDTWEPTKLERQILCLSKMNCQVCYTGLNYIGSDGELLGGSGDCCSYSGKVTAQLFKANFVAFSTVMVERKYLLKVGGSRESIRRSDDWDLLLRLSVICNFCYLPEKLMDYRKQRTGRISADLEGRFVSINNIAKDFIQNYPKLISKQEVCDATAYRYRNQAYMYKIYGSSLCKDYFFKSFYYYLISLKYRPFSFATYKGLFGLLIGKRNTGIFER